eukprot:2704478-Amphidinium_carterae.1
MFGYQRQVCLTPCQHIAHNLYGNSKTLLPDQKKQLQEESTRDSEQTSQLKSIYDCRVFTGGPSLGFIPETLALNNKMLQRAPKR